MIVWANCKGHLNENKSLVKEKPWLENVLFRNKLVSVKHASYVQRLFKQLQMQIFPVKLVAFKLAFLASQISAELLEGSTLAMEEG